jgi:hypothetical protein
MHYALCMDYYLYRETTVVSWKTRCIIRYMPSAKDHEDYKARYCLRMTARFTTPSYLVTLLIRTGKALMRFGQAYQVD